MSSRHTSETIKVLSRYGPVGKAAVMPHASFIEPVSLPQEECKVKLGLAGKQVVTMFGFVSRSKGHDLAIDAFKEMPEDVVLYIAGDGRTPEDKAYVDELKAKAAGMGGKVRFHGYVKEEDTPVVMCASDIVLMPYRHVVQSGALNYALAYGKPVLASNMGGFAEVARGYNCIETFEPGSIQALTSGLTSMLADDGVTARLKDKASAYVDAVGIERIAGRTFEAYEKLINGQKNNGRR